jgi:hypothetical protein
MYILSYTSLYSCNGEWSSATRLAGLVTFLGSTVKSVAFQRKNLRRFFSSNLEPEHGKTHLLAGIGAITPKKSAAERALGNPITQTSCGAKYYIIQREHGQKGCLISLPPHQAQPTLA